MALVKASWPRPMARLHCQAPPSLEALRLSCGFLQLPTIFRSRRFGPEGRSGAQSGAGWVAGSWGWMFRRCPRHYRFPSQHRPSVGRRSCGTCTSPPACLLLPTPPAIGHQEGELGQLGEVLTKVVRKHGEISRVRLMCISRDWKAALEPVDNDGPLQILLCTITVLVCVAPREQIVVENVKMYQLNMYTEKMRSHPTLQIERQRNIADWKKVLAWPF